MHAPLGELSRLQPVCVFGDLARLGQLSICCDCTELRKAARGRGTIRSNEPTDLFWVSTRVLMHLLTRSRALEESIRVPGTTGGGEDAERGVA